MFSSAANAEVPKEWRQKLRRMLKLGILDFSLKTQKMDLEQ